jgi:hypothetical protein
MNFLKFWASIGIGWFASALALRSSDAAAATPDGMTRVASMAFDSREILLLVLTLALMGSAALASRAVKNREKNLFAASKNDETSEKRAA